MAAVTDDADKQLAWEARHRPRAGIASLVATAGLLAFYAGGQFLQSDAPKSSGLESLLRAAQPGDNGRLPSLQIPFFEYIDSKAALMILIGVGGLLGFVGIGWAVGFLGVATRARLPTFRFMIYLPIVGGTVYGISVLIVQVARLMQARNVLDSSRTVAAVTGASNDWLRWGQLLLELGSLVLAAGLVLVSLNAMRAGLLTRMYGYIGIVAGAMLILFPLPIVQIFWVGSLGVLFLRRWPGGDLPAWRTGKAEPWPVAQRGTRRPAPAPAAGPAPAPAARRRKRKKRH